MALQFTSENGRQYVLLKICRICPFCCFMGTQLLCWQQELAWQPVGNWLGRRWGGWGHGKEDPEVVLVFSSNCQKLYHKQRILNNSKRGLTVLPVFPGSDVIHVLGKQLWVAVGNGSLGRSLGTVYWGSRRQSTFIRVSIFSLESSLGSRLWTLHLVKGLVKFPCSFRLALGAIL